MHSKGLNLKGMSFLLTFNQELSQGGAVDRSTSAPPLRSTEAPPLPPRQALDLPDPVCSHMCTPSTRASGLHHPGPSPSLCTASPPSVPSGPFPLGFQPLPGSPRPFMALMQGLSYMSLVALLQLNRDRDPEPCLPCSGMRSRAARRGAELRNNL